MASPGDDLQAKIDAARRSALKPEQALNRMISRRRVSRSALMLALGCYEGAAEAIRQALDLLKSVEDSRTDA